MDPDKSDQIQIFTNLLSLDISPCLQKYLIKILTVRVN
jgi:hypothetical protein